MEDKKWLSLEEVCRILGKSKRTIGRYIKDGKLKPKKVGTQYQFKESEVNKLISDNIGQSEPQSDIVAYLFKQLDEKDNQLERKDEQIEEMNQRQRELNLMLNNEQNKNLLLLEDKSKNKGVIRDWFDRLFKRGD